MATGPMHVSCEINKDAMAAIEGVVDCINGLSKLAEQQDSLESKSLVLAAATHMERLVAAVVTEPLVRVGEIIKVSP